MYRIEQQKRHIIFYAELMGKVSSLCCLGCGFEGICGAEADTGAFGRFSEGHDGTCQTSFIPRGGELCLA